MKKDKIYTSSNTSVNANTSSTNEFAGISIYGNLKIIDLDTSKVLLNKRV